MRTSGLFVSVATMLSLLFGCNQSAPRSEGNSKLEKPPAPNKISETEASSIVSPQPSDATPTGAASLDTEHTPSIDELLLFFPTKHPDGNWNPRNLEFEDVWITSDDGTRIHGWYCPCENPKAQVLYAHGNAGNLSHRAGLLKYLQNNLRVSTLIFDYRGYGRSEGFSTTSGAIADTRAASKYLANRAGVNESDLVLMGRSLGGALVVQVACDTKPRGLIIESSFASLKQMASLHYPKLAWIVPRKKLDSADAIKSYAGQLLQSHGTHDRTIPYTSGVELYDAARTKSKTFIEIPNADHNDPMPNSYYATMNKYFAELARESQ